MLALPPSDTTLKTEGEIFDDYSLGPKKSIEPVGKSYAKLQGKFHRAMLRQQIAEGKDTDKKGRKIVVEDSDEEEKGESQEFSEGQTKDFEKKRKKKTKEEIEKEALLMDDLYAILGLEEKKFEASEAEIGKAYKKMALIFHPDKLGEKLTQKDKDVWLQIQNAYETLTDLGKRRKYDSSCPFDEDIPKSEDITDANFFELYNETFQNNARFSVIKPVPNLGDMSTPMDEVYKFYSFWDNFKTWREFS